MVTCRFLQKQLTFAGGWPIIVTIWKPLTGRSSRAAFLQRAAQGGKRQEAPREWPRKGRQEMAGRMPRVMGESRAGLGLPIWVVPQAQACPIRGAGFFCFGVGCGPGRRVFVLSLSGPRLGRFAAGSWAAAPSPARGFTPGPAQKGKRGSLCDLRTGPLGPPLSF
mgnify:CR=1